MRGHLPIIAMRQRGMVPRTVFLDAFEDPSKSWRQWPRVCMESPQVEILPDESLPMLDLRFLSGLRVMLTGHERRRVQAIRDACVEAGAARVVAVLVVGDEAEIFDTYGEIGA